MYQIIKQILKTGIKTEKPPLPDESLRTGEQRIHEDILKYFGNALPCRCRFVQRLRA